MDMITKGHILTAALEYLGMTSLDGVPDPSKIDTNIWMEDDIIEGKINGHSHKDS